MENLESLINEIATNEEFTNCEKSSELTDIKHENVTADENSDSETIDNWLDLS